MSQLRGRHARAPGRPGGMVVSAIVALVALGSVGLGVRAQEAPGPAIDWQTDVVHLTADALALEVDSLTFTARDVPVVVGSDPGGPERWTLEAEWTEHGVEQRLYLYFASDGQAWWVDELRTYDGAPEGEWVTFGGPHFRTPLGQAYEGDVRLEGLRTGPPGGPAIRGILSIDGLRLEVAPRSLGELFAAPPGGGIAAERDPFEPGAPLHCSGILQLDPSTAHERLLEAGYRVSYRLLHPSRPAVVLTAPPEGTIESSSLGGHGEVIIFVNDPALGAAAVATMPPECPNAPTPAPLGPLDPAVFTGTMESMDWYGSPDVTRGPVMHVEEGVTFTASWQASDPRISGDVSYTGTWHSFPMSSFHVEAATLVVGNADGRWVGTAQGLVADDFQPFTAVLAGEGAYEGLTAFVSVDWWGSSLQGAIFTGPMPEAPGAP